jgi:pyruvate, orthophosphate dikinase
MKQIYKFSADHCDWSSDQKNAKTILGGKGAGLVMMAKDGLPVPPGFTITTEVCNQYRKKEGSEREFFLDDLMVEVMEHMDWLDSQFGCRPLVSVRSGAPVSMPGMMDTILNVGLTNSNLSDWCDRLGARAAYDSKRRLIQMLSSTAYGVPHEVFDFQLEKVKKSYGGKNDTDLDNNALAALCGRYEHAFQENRGFDFPVDSAVVQLRAAVKAVFDSWMNPRAIEYRKLNGISEEMGTAVNVQAMVFGNMGEDSGSGVLFTRNPSTGDENVMGEFLQNAQGEDVVAGIRTPIEFSKMEGLGGKWPKVHQQLLSLCIKLEDAYKDMVDIEFTVQQGELFLLQSRTGKRSARAAFKIATDLVEEGKIDKKTAIGRLTAEQFKMVRRPTIDPNFKAAPRYEGLPACPGVVSGKPVFSADDAVDCKEPCILVTHETTPEDIKGMAAAVGVLTQTGGATSHAAVVARAMDKACVVGATGLSWTSVKAAKKITIDGSTGRVWLDVDVPVLDSSDAPEIKTVMGWCMDVLGACEIAPVDLGMDGPHRIMAAYWWGNAEVLDAVLDGIAELPSRGHVTLDVTPPRKLAPTSDALLADCFGTNPTEQFWNVVGERLTARTDLKGLMLLDPPGAHWDAKLFDTRGYVRATDGVQAVPMAVPAEYAAFTVLCR